MSNELLWDLHITSKIGSLPSRQEGDTDLQSSETALDVNIMKESLDLYSQH